MSTITELEAEQRAELLAARAVPEFSHGDTVRVWVKVREGEKERLQAYEGVVIGRSGAGINESFTVRKISYGEGVERVFPVLSPMIDRIEVVRRGKVRRAKLYYLRSRRGKSARIGEATNARTRRIQEAERTAAADARAQKAADELAAKEQAEREAKEAEEAAARAALEAGEEEAIAPPADEAPEPKSNPE